MVIELSGVQFGLKSYAWFQNQTGAQREFDLKSQVRFQTKIAWHEVQLLCYIHFEITQIQDLIHSNILLMQYWAGLKLNSSIFWREKVRVLETKVAKFATWYSLWEPLVSAIVVIFFIIVLSSYSPLALDSCFFCLLLIRSEASWTGLFSTFGLTSFPSSISQKHICQVK